MNEFNRTQQVGNFCTRRVSEPRRARDGKPDWITKINVNDQKHRSNIRNRTNACTTVVSGKQEKTMR